MLISEIQGPKFPDEFVVRFFYKEKLHQKKGKVLELGTYTGINLNLFYQYGHQVVGVDISDSSLELANLNFAKLKQENPTLPDYTFVCSNMLDYVTLEKGSDFDVVMLPSSLYYMRRSEIETLMRKFRTFLKKGTLFYFRMRTTDDYRYGKGVEVEKNSFRISIPETDEQGTIISFFTRDEFLALLQEYLTPSRLLNFRSNSENIQAEKMIYPDSDLIVWGEI